MDVCIQIWYNKDNKEILQDFLKLQNEKENI